MESRNCQSSSYNVSDSLHEELTNFKMQFFCLCYFESYDIGTRHLIYYVIFQSLK